MPLPKFPGDERGLKEAREERREVGGVFCAMEQHLMNDRLFSALHTATTQSGMYDEQRSLPVEFQSTDVDDSVTLFHSGVRLSSNGIWERRSRLPDLPRLRRELIWRSLEQIIGLRDDRSTACRYRARA